MPRLWCANMCKAKNTYHAVDACNTLNLCVILYAVFFSKKRDSAKYLKIQIMWHINEYFIYLSLLMIGFWCSTFIYHWTWNMPYVYEQFMVCLIWLNKPTDFIIQRNSNEIATHYWQRLKLPKCEKLISVRNSCARVWEAHELLQSRRSFSSKLSIWHYT